MWREELSKVVWTSGFFRVGLSHNNLINMVKTNFAMIQHHKWSLTEIEAMMPWERDLYVGLLNEHIEEENKRIAEENAKMRH